MPEIRPEACPVNWKELDEGQQDALKRIIKMLHCALPKNEPTFQTYHLNKPYSEERSSRLAFLDGGRGTGKTTIMVTLLKFITIWVLMIHPKTNHQKILLMKLKRFITGSFG